MSAEGRLIHNRSLCSDCGACLTGCYRKNFSRNEQEKVHLNAGHESNCILCGHCIAACPREGALSIRGEEWKPGGEGTAIPDAEKVMALLKGRRTRRSYSQKEVSRSDLEDLLDAARYAPSGHNSQNFHFTVLEGKEKVAKIGKAVLNFYGRISRLLASPLTRPLVYLAAGNSNYRILMEMRQRLEDHQRIYRETGSIEMTWNAPALIIIHGPEGQDTMINCALAGNNIMLQAEAMGLGTCVLGILRGGIGHAGKDLKEEGVEFPPGHAVYLILAVGHPDGSEKFKNIPPRRKAGTAWI